MYHPENEEAVNTGEQTTAIQQVSTARWRFENKMKLDIRKIGCKGFAMK
jgi:hypothetical protein